MIDQDILYKQAMAESQMMINQYFQEHPQCAWIIFRLNYPEEPEKLVILKAGDFDAEGIASPPSEEEIEEECSAVGTLYFLANNPNRPVVKH